MVDAHWRTLTADRRASWSVKGSSVAITGAVQWLVSRRRTGNAGKFPWREAHFNRTPDAWCDHPALIDAIPTIQLRPCDDQPMKGPLSQLAAALADACRGDRGQMLDTSGACRAGMVPAFWTGAFTMSLTLAREHAFSLATTLMTCVILFKAGDGFGAMPTAEFDGEPESIVLEFDPFQTA